MTLEMSDALRMTLLKELMFGKEIWDLEYRNEIYMMYDFGLIKVYDQNLEFAATTELGIEELHKLIKLYFVFLN